MWPFRRRGKDPDVHPAASDPAAARYAVIDSELTGLDPRRDSIVSLGGIRIREGRIVLADRFYEEVQPASALTASSIVLHGITPEDVRGRPGIGAVLEEFSAFCSTDILIGHFVELDLGFLRAAYAKAGLPPIANPVLDTWPLYDWMSSRTPEDGGPGLPRLKDPRLPALAQALGIHFLDSHNALGDAYVTAQVFQRLLRRLERWGIMTTTDLLRHGDPKHALHNHNGHAPPLT